jgi:MFS family permease
MLAILRQRNFFLLWSGFLISSLGDWLLITALPFYIYGRTGSAFATGALYIAETLPILFFSTLAGVLVDRWNRRHVLLFSHILSAALLLFLLPAQSPTNLWLVYIVACAESILAQFTFSASSALVPHLVTNNQLTAANAANSFSQEIARLLGPALGGLLLGFFGFASVILIDSFSFCCCTLLIWFIALPIQKMHVHPTLITSSLAEIHTAKRSNIPNEWRKGLLLLREKRFIAALFLVANISMLGEGFGRVIFVPFLRNIIHLNALEFGWVVTIQGVGGVIGALCHDRLRKSIPTTLLIAVSGLLLGIFNLMIVLFPSFSLLLMIYFCGGGPVVFFFIGIVTLLQQSTPDSYRGRIFGLYSTLNTVLLLISMLFASTFATLLGARFIFSLMGAFYFLAGLVALCVLRTKHQEVLS